MNNKKLDRTFEKKVNHVQMHNGINVIWDKEGVWKRIQKMLQESSSGPKMIAWYTAMAASVSLLVAGTANFLEYELPSSPEEDEPQTVNEIRVTPPVTADVSFTAMAADSMVIPIKSRKVPLSSHYLDVSTADKLELNREQVNLIATSRTTPNRFTSSPALKARLAGGISVNSQFVTPKIDLGIVVKLPSASNVRNGLFLGGSIQLMKSIQTEQGQTSGVSPAYFVKSAFESEKMKNGKLRSWSTGAEYLIHSRDDSVSENLLRLYYNRSILGRLKIGPEIMFTRGFKKAYPGITLALG